MRILAIDTSSLVASCAITEDGKLLGQYTLNHKMTHSQTIMPMIDGLVKMCQINMETINYIACSEGPGSFTGLRIGTATAKGLALGLNIPIIPVPTLEALAYNVVNNNKLICPIMDARRGQIYTGIFTFEGEKLITILESSALTIDEIIEKALSFNKEVIFLGDGVAVHKEKLEEYSQFSFAPLNACVQSGAAVAALAEVLLSEEKAINGEDFVPVYLRKPQAERELEEKNRENIND
ncbi:MAG: tRNA (adenosine(37)-N6)-threonylcarbamoyltransferase complex dimerization subunit type 1 TsaB [Anaerotignaceae bacterium]